MADLDEENTSEQEMPALTEAISAILSEVKALKEQVTTLKECVELVEADPEVKESLMDNENNDDSESLYTGFEITENAECFNNLAGGNN